MLTENTQIKINKELKKKKKSLLNFLLRIKREPHKTILKLIKQLLIQKQQKKQKYKTNPLEKKNRLLKNGMGIYEDIFLKKKKNGQNVLTLLNLN